MPDTMTLHDLTSSPWCPKCGQISCTALHEKPRTGGMLCESMAFPALFTRLPESRPEGLEWCNIDNCWKHTDEINENVTSYGRISDAHAEKLLRGHWEEQQVELGNIVILSPGDHPQVSILEPHQTDEGGHCGIGDTLAEAWVMSLHRLCDSQEKNLNQPERLKAKAEVAGDLYREDKISRAECFRAEVDQAVEQDSGPIDLDADSQEPKP